MNKKKDLSRSLTNNPSFLSSSAPPVSFVNFAQKDFAPSIGTIVEKPKEKSSDEKKEVLKFSPKNTDKHNKNDKSDKSDVTTEKHPLPEELLATVGSPTIFSMLKSDSDVRRKSSVASNNSLPNTNNTNSINTTVINEDLKREEEDDEDDHGHVGNNQLQFDEDLNDNEDGDLHTSSSAAPITSSTSTQKDDFFF